ncbi:hypothetical protein [Streptomyces sp. NBC_01171]|uniref:hypothetical protein n=1 Tax=Streptomyces sp. NBC_01171 TaxID=2903757 RepID=UPI00386B5CB2|nr:hypothetical protein OG448_30410 [Streptomyces sp. NBC_01171]
MEAHWRLRLRRLLAADPAAADELRDLLAEWAPAEEQAVGGTVFRVDLRDARGIQVGDGNTQHNQF